MFLIEEGTFDGSSDGGSLGAVDWTVNYFIQGGGITNLVGVNKIPYVKDFLNWFDEKHTFFTEKDMRKWLDEQYKQYGKNDSASTDKITDQGFNQKAGVQISIREQNISLVPIMEVLTQINRHTQIGG